MKKTRTATFAFTLIELLVVISIVSLLVAVLLPALASARGAARNSQCLTNVRSQATGFHLYASDFNEYAPPRYIRRPSATWIGPAGYPSYHDALLSDDILLGQYTDNETLANGLQAQFGYFKPGSVWGCPDYPNGLGAAQCHYSGSMTILAKCDSASLWTEMWRLSSITNPAILLGTADSGSGGFHPGYTGQLYTITDEDSYSVGTFSVGSVLYKSNLRIRHNNRTTTNISFFDGHAANFKTPHDDYLAGKIDIDRPK